MKDQNDEQGKAQPVKQEKNKQTLPHGFSKKQNYHQEATAEALLYTNVKKKEEGTN